MPELKITVVDVDELVPYANNAKLHTAEQVDQIAASIEEFGNCDPIAVWHNSDGEPEIVEGHGRLMALKKLGIKKVPVITLDHLSDEQRRAYGLAHNKLTMNSGFDISILQGELDQITSIDMSVFSFDINNGELDSYGDIPEEFKEYGEDIDTTNKCPRCGYEW